MAKSGLDYFPLACSFEDKIELIEAEFGLRGLAIIVKLYQKIYGEFGYYCEWNDEVALLFSRKACGLPEGDNVVSEVIKAAIKREIFDNNMFLKYSILTSAGIQKRYFEAAKRRNEIEVEINYLLISTSKIPKNVNIIQENVCKNRKNAYINQQSKEKESKENKNHCAPEPHEDSFTKEVQLKKDFEIIYGIYPKKKGKTVAFANYKQWVGKGKDVGGTKYRLTNRQIYLAVKKYIKQQEEEGKDDLQYWKNFDTLMGRQLLDYVEDSDKK